MEYPDYVSKACDGRDGKSIIYILEIKPGEYKFGITFDIVNRLRTHYRHLQYCRVVEIFDCTYDSVMRYVETKFKRYAKSIGVLCTKYKLTEIIIVEDVKPYVEWFRERIYSELQKPQPQNMRERHVPQYNVNVDNKKCYNCGKTFRTPGVLAQHKARKTPCIIRDISEENKKNPLRCIYCNKIFSRIPNLTKHSKTCKIKNGGLDTLVDKVKYDEKLRITKEENMNEVNEVKKIVAAQAELLTAMQASHEAMAKELETLKRGINPSQTQNITVNNTMVNK